MTDAFVLTSPLFVYAKHKQKVEWLRQKLDIFNFLSFIIIIA